MDTVVGQFVTMIVNHPEIIVTDTASIVYRDFAIRLLSWVGANLSSDLEEYQTIQDALLLIPEEIMDAAIKRFDND